MVADRGQSPVLGRYHIISENTSGAFGTVLIAWDPKLQRRVAIKRIPLITEHDIDKLGKAPTTLLSTPHGEAGRSITSRIATTLLNRSSHRTDTVDAPDEPTTREDKPSHEPAATRSSIHESPVAHRTNNDEADGVPPAYPAYHEDEAVRLNRLQQNRTARPPQQETFQTEAQRVKRAALKEARTAGMLSHPNIVLMHDFDVEDDAAYLIMEYIDGITLADLLDVAGQLNADVVAHIAQSVGNALGFAHENGVLHLDIKPENILIDRSGTVKIADFGMANLMSASGYRNARGGTVGYMPLEQIDLEELSEASDIFSFAAVIFECLTDQAPFMAPNAQASRELLIAGAPDVLTLSEEASEQTADLLEQALSSFVAFRPVDAQAFGLALAKSLGSAKRGQTTLVQDLDVLLTEAHEQELADVEVSEAEEVLAQARWLPGCLIYERPLMGEAIVRSMRFICVYMAVWALMQALPLEPRATLSALVGLVLAALSLFSPSLILGLLFACSPTLLAVSGITAFMNSGNDRALLAGLIGSVILLLINIATWLSAHLVRPSVAGILCAPALLIPGIGVLMITALTQTTSSITATVTPVSFGVSVSALGVLAILCGLWLPRLTAAVVSGTSVIYGQLFWTTAHMCAPSSLLSGFGGTSTDISAVMPALMEAFATPSFYLFLVTNILVALLVATIMPGIRRRIWGFEQVQTYARLHNVPVNQLGILLRPTYPADLIQQFQLEAEAQQHKGSLDEYAHNLIDGRELTISQAHEVVELYEAETEANRWCWLTAGGALLILAAAQTVHIWKIIPHIIALSSGNTTGFAINALISMALCFILLILIVTLCGRALPVPSRKELRIFLNTPQQ